MGCNPGAGHVHRCASCAAGGEAVTREQDYLAGEEFMLQFELEQERRMEAVRQDIIAAGRLDLLAEHDQNMRDIRSGITGARNCWHSISAAQRTALLFAIAGGGLRKISEQPSEYANINGNRPPSPIRIATVRALAAHELVAWDGGATTPERRALVTERGRFVAIHGPVKEATP